MDHKLFRVNQNALIIDPNGKILILKNKFGWGLPGGRLENDNTWNDGLLREIQEETGIQKVGDIKIVDVDLSDSKETYITYFICKIFENPTIRLSDEHSEFAWVDKNTLNNYQFAFPGIQEKIRQFLN